VSVLLGNRGAKICILGLNSFAITLFVWNVFAVFPRSVQILLLLSMAFPLSAAILTYHKARPGTRLMFYFVTCNILMTIGITIWMILLYFLLK
jgi:hypothetical protein